MLSFGNFILAVSFILSTEFDKKALETACVIVAIIVMGLFIEVQENHTVAAVLKMMNICVPFNISDDESLFPYSSPLS